MHLCLNFKVKREQEIAVEIMLKNILLKGSLSLLSNS